MNSSAQKVREGGGWVSSVCAQEEGGRRAPAAFSEKEEEEEPLTFTSFGTAALACFSSATKKKCVSPLQEGAGGMRGRSVSFEWAQRDC